MSYVQYTFNIETTDGISAKRSIDCYDNSPMIDINDESECGSIAHELTLEQQIIFDAFMCVMQDLSHSDNAEWKKNPNK